MVDPEADALQDLDLLASKRQTTPHVACFQSRCRRGPHFDEVAYAKRRRHSHPPVEFEACLNRLCRSRCPRWANPSPRGRYRNRSSKWASRSVSVMRGMSGPFAETAGGGPQSDGLDPHAAAVSTSRTFSPSRPSRRLRRVTRQARRRGRTVDHDGSRADRAGSPDGGDSPTRGAVPTAR